jgi:uncharacterized protein
MQLTLRLLVALSTVALCQHASAVEPAHQQLIERLLVLNQNKEQYEAGVIGSFEASIASTAKSLPPDQQEKFGKAMERVKALMVERLGWEVLKVDVIELYAKRFTQEELEAVLPLLDKPELQAFLVKQTSLNSELSKIAAEKSQVMQPEIMKIVQEEMMK